MCIPLLSILVAFQDWISCREVKEEFPNVSQSKRCAIKGKRQLVCMLYTDLLDELQFPEKIKIMHMNRELAYLLGFVNHPKHCDARIRDFKLFQASYFIKSFETTKWGYFLLFSVC